MRKKVFVLVIGCMMLVSVFGSSADASAQGPQAFLPETVYEFQPVVEGSQVVHEFILYNRGDESLEILDIKSG